MAMHSATVAMVPQYLTKQRRGEGRGVQQEAGVRKWAKPCVQPRPCVLFTGQ